MGIRRKPSSLLALVSALMLIAAIARAEDMGSMDMGGMTHSMMPEAGENASSMDMMMSSEHMEHDPTMAAHMGYTTLRPKSEAISIVPKAGRDAANRAGEIQGLSGRRGRRLQAVSSGNETADRPLHQDVVRAKGAVHLQSLAANFAPL